MRNAFRAVILAAAMAAAFLGSLIVGTANAAPSRDQDPVKTNVHLNVTSAFVQGLKPPKQLYDWYVTVYPINDVTVTLSTKEMYDREGQQAGQTLAWARDHFGGAGIETGQAMLKGHFGENGDYVAGPVDIFAGNPDYTLSANFTPIGSYKPILVGQQVVTTAGVKSAAASGTKAAGAAKPAATTPKAALCKMVGSTPITTTGTANIMAGSPGEVFTGRLLFVTVPTTTLTVEATLDAYAKDPKLGEERSFEGLAPGTAVTVHTGNLRVFRLVSGAKPAYLGDLNAISGGRYVNLSRITGVCEAYDLHLAGTKPGTTGAAEDLLALLALAFGVVVVWGSCGFPVPAFAGTSRQ